MKIALGIEYNGYGFHGWQHQGHCKTIQGTLDEALSHIADHPIQTICAGRTDSGVHATGQVVHFETDVMRDTRAWLMGTNSHLPERIAVKWVQLVDEHFHARFSAISRRYRYIIYNHPARPALLAHRVTWNYDTLNLATMQAAGQFLLGEHDFSSFRSSQCESKSPMREVQLLNVSRQGDFIFIDIQANAFLHHMVRNIVGVLVRIGRGLKEPEWMQELLLKKDRKEAAETAPAAGLYLVKVEYRIPYDFPTMNLYEILDSSF